MKAGCEEVRKAQFLKNQARLASFGVQKTIGELRTKSQSEKRRHNKVDYFSAPASLQSIQSGCSLSLLPAKQIVQFVILAMVFFAKVVLRFNMVKTVLEMEDVIANKEWICPHCTEEKGINPYWICNSSLCLKKRKMAPTGIDIFRAREMGYKSVAHLFMDQLQGAVKGR